MKNAFISPFAAAAFCVGGTGLASAQEPVHSLEEVHVNASADASAEGLVPAYAGGQVAKGGRVGILGNKDTLDTPFALTSYTHEFIQDQQAKGVGDVLQSDPFVSVARGFGNFQESYFIRGFLLDSDDISYNGLYGILPRQYIASELFERVEVLRGASAFLSGATPSGGGIGGAINLLPKRAVNEPLTQVSVGTNEKGQAYVATDISRRFGPEQSAGLRLNAAYRDGKTGIDREKTRLAVGALAWDWHNRETRISADIGYQDHRLTAPRPNVTLTDVTQVPNAPKNTLNWAQDWSYSNAKGKFATLRTEHDFAQHLTGWLALGIGRGDEDNALSNPRITDAQTGAGQSYRFDNTRKDNNRSAELGLRNQLQIGAVTHDFVATYATFDTKRKNAYAFDWKNTYDVNIYAPQSLGEAPAFSDQTIYGNALSSPQLNVRNTLSSFAFGDTMSMFNDKVQLIVGLRRQTIHTRDYAYNSGVLSGEYKKSRTTPVLGIVIKPQDNLSVYANYIESLAQGATASGTHNNKPIENLGEQLAPYVSKQKEIGLKYDAGQIGFGVAAFTTKKPRSIINEAGYFTNSGKDQHRGLELSTYGQISPDLRVIAGLTFLDAQQKETGQASTDGKQVIGVAKRQASLSADWRVPMVQGLALNARLSTTSSRYADAANTLRVPGWTRLDLGARYIRALSDQSTLTLRARIDNVANRNYWASAGGYPNSGYLVSGAPRAFALTATVDFY